MDDAFKSRVKILIADDSADVRTIMQTYLVDLGYLNIYQASSGTAAIEVALKRDVDLILCDWNMPGASGLEVLTILRETEKHKETPFVMLTSEAFRDNVKKAIKAGVSKYVVKPVNSSELKAILEELLINR